MPTYPGEHCPLCGENPEISYICEDCREIFCEDCVVISTEEVDLCVDCGSKNVSKGRGNNFCRDCGSRNLRILKNLIPSCRHCGNMNVIKIEEKQDQLLNRYKKSIQDTREFYAPFENTVEKLNNYRNKLFQLRQDPPHCYHYPELETEFQTVLKLFDSAQKNIYKHVSKFFVYVQHNINYIREIQITHPSNYNFITEILNHVEQERKKVIEISNNDLDPITRKFLPIEKKIEFMKKIQSKFLPYLAKLKLSDDEKIVFALKCKLSMGNDPDKGYYTNKSGTVFLTSKRLYFVHEQGVFKKQSVVLFAVKITDLREANIEGRLSKKVSLEFLRSMYKFTIEKENREKLVKWVNNAMDFEYFYMKNDKNFKIFSSYKINIDSFREELENAIYELIGFHGSREDLNKQNPSCRAVNFNMYRTTRLPGPKTKSSAGRFQVDVPQKDPSFRTSSGGFNQPKPGDSDPTIRINNNNNGINFPKPSYETPSGHYGYPHDRDSYNEINNVDDLNNTYQVPTNSIFPPSFNNSPHPGQYDSNTNNPANFGINTPYGDGINPPKSDIGNPFMNSSRSNEEIRLKKELNLLKQEEYALKHTLKMLEKRYDAGYIQNPEFVKYYQETQRKLYVYSSKITQLERYVKKKFGDFNEYI